MSTNFPPQSAQSGTPSQPGFAQSQGSASPHPGYGQAPYGQPGYGQAPYGQPGYGQAPYGQPGAAAYAGFPGFRGMSSKSKLAAGLLGIFLGVLGVHNFYLGNIGKAVAQLLITILSLGILSVISAIWGIIEGILILASKPGTEWHRDADGLELLD